MRGTMRAAVEFAILAAIMMAIGVGAALVFFEHPGKDLFLRPPAEPVCGDATDKLADVAEPGAPRMTVHGVVVDVTGREV